MVMGGPACPFNLVDIYQKILGVKEIQIPQVELKDTNPEEITLLIHPFASHPKKEWNLSKWTEIIFQLAKDYPQSKIVVSGSCK